MQPGTPIPAPGYQPDDQSGRKIVAVIGHANDWAAYMGPTDWTDDDVAKRGDKIDRELAERLFPSIVRAGFHWRR